MSSTPTTPFSAEWVTNILPNQWPNSYATYSNPPEENGALMSRPRALPYVTGKAMNRTTKPSAWETAGYFQGTALLQYDAVS